MANFLLTQTGEEVQTILNEAPETKEGLQQEVTNREQAITAEEQARNEAIAAALRDYYTKTQTDDKLADYATIVAMSEAISLAISNYYTKDETDTKLSVYSTTTEMQQAIQTAITAALTAYSTTQDMNAAIAAALGDYYTKQEVTAIASLIDDKISALASRVSDIESGETPAKLADNLKSWAQRGEVPENDEWANKVRTTAGDMSIDSSRTSRLLSVIPLSPFYAQSLRATGFNLLHGAQAAGSGYYFEVPALTFGMINAAEQNNGVLFTNQHGDNLRPTVYFKPLTEGVPQHANDGVVADYRDEGGYRFYLCSEPGYIVVSNITLEDTCAHIAWSRRYNEFVSPDSAEDAGSSLPLASLIHTIHDYDLMLRAEMGEQYVYDELRANNGNVNWFRRVERIQPEWTTADNGDGTYTHTATIADMKANGIAQCGSLALTVNGTTIAYTDNQSAPTGDYVLYQLSEPVSGIVEQDNAFSVEDWGLEILVDAQGDALITTQYYQSLPDAIAALLTKVPGLRNDLTDETNRRVEEVVALQREINNEKTRAEQAEQTLQGNIDTEAQARQQADTALDGKIADEKSRAEGSEQTLQGNIDTEAAARQQADTALDGKIAAEKSRAEGAEQTLQGNIDAEAAARQQADSELGGRISDIEAVIPAAASPQNKLADIEFVNSSIASNTGNLQGNYNLVTDLGLTVAATDTEIGTALAGEIANPGNNDYCFVGVPVNDETPDEISVTKRFKYNSAQQTWVYEYSLNNSTFTAAQFDAINSGITAALVGKLGDLPTATALAQQISTAISTALTDYYTKSNIDTLIANYSTTTQMTTAIAQAIANYYTKTEVDNLIADYYTKSETNTLLSEKQTAAQVSAAITAALADYSTTTQMTTAISDAIATALADYSTTADMNTAISNAIAAALADYSTSQQVAAAIAAALEPYATQQQMNVAIASALTSYYTKTEIDNILAGYVQTGTFNSHTGNTTVHITAAERQTWNAKQAAITDGAQIGLGFGVSSEAATVQARTATIPSFILLKNMPVSIRFTNAINVVGATLNISSTGAKPIYIDGNALQPGVIRPGMVATMIYDGTNWNIVALQGLEQSAGRTDYMVDMGLPSGLLWADRNIDATQPDGFCESPYQYEGSFFSWGNTEPHNPTSTSAFGYDWGTITTARMPRHQARSSTATWLRRKTSCGPSAVLPSACRPRKISRSSLPTSTTCKPTARPSSTHRRPTSW